MFSGGGGIHNNGGGGHRPQQQQLVQTILPNPDQVFLLVTRGIVQIAKRNKVLTSGYIIGLVLILIVGNGRPLSHHQQHNYHRIMNSIDLQMEYDASTEYWKAKHAYDSTKGWFWTCDSLCQRNQQRMKQAQQHLLAIRKEGQARMSDAKRTAGILSQIGIGEIKDSFWTFFHQGQQYAKRQSMWDMLFMSIRTMSRGRDESWIEFGIKILFQILLNVSMGLIMALLFFIMSIWTIIQSYQLNPIIAVICFIGISLAGISFVFSYLITIYGITATSIYTVLKVGEVVAVRAAQLEQQQHQTVHQYPQQQQQQQRPHYD